MFFYLSKLVKITSNAAPWFNNSSSLNKGNNNRDSATRRTFNFPLGEWKCGQKRSFVFDILLGIGLGNLRSLHRSPRRVSDSRYLIKISREHSRTQQQNDVSFQPFSYFFVQILQIRYVTWYKQLERISGGKSKL